MVSFIEIIQKCIDQNLIDGKIANTGYNTLILEFRDPRDAIVLATRFNSNYFPSDKGYFKLRYEPSLAFGFSQIQDKKEELKDRKYMVISDISHCHETWRELPSTTIYWFDDCIRSGIETALNYLRDAGIDEREAIICITSLGEDFYDAIGSYILRSLGFIVIPQEVYSLFEYIWGVPDLIAVKLGRFQEDLIKAGVIEYGALLMEFELYGLFGKRKYKAEPRKIDQEISVVVEVKGESRVGSRGHKQLNKYLNSGLFNYGVLICPGRIDDQRYYPDHGVITWDYDGNVITYFPDVNMADLNKVEFLLKSVKRFILRTLMNYIKLNELIKFKDKCLADLIESIVNEELSCLELLNP